MSPLDVIEAFQLAPLPGEGGFFRETYRGPVSAGGSRSLSTCIYYLLTQTTYSAFHRLASDEIYHFYRGGSVELFTIDADGRFGRTVLGSRWEVGEQCQWWVPAGTWQAARLLPGGEFALLGTTVTPGFEFADCQLADRGLVERYPLLAETIAPLLPAS